MGWRSDWTLPRGSRGGRWNSLKAQLKGQLRKRSQRTSAVHPDGAVLLNQRFLSSSFPQKKDTRLLAEIEKGNRGGPTPISPPL